MLELKVDGFSGPLDLLLDLIERKQLDITALSLAEVADQYWQHVESQHDLEPDALADFILVGSKLLYIKSCALLPSAAPPKEELRPDDGDGAAELTRMVEEYRRFRDAAEILGDLEEKGQRTYTRLGPGNDILLPPGLQGVTVDTLMQAVREALARTPPEPEEGVLEMIKAGRLWAEQRRPFGDITLIETAPEPA